MSPSWTLCKKELSEHRWVLVSLLLSALIFALLCLLTAAQLPGFFSPLSVVWAYTQFLLPLFAVVLGHQLIVREYLGRTQRFLETMPVSGQRTLLVKWQIGFISLLIISFIILVIGCYQAAPTEQLDLRFIFILVMRIVAIAIISWGLVFFLSFCGALRIPIFVAIVLVFYLLQKIEIFGLTDSGPLSLLDHMSFVFESYLIPWNTIFMTLALGLLASAGGMFLARFRQGSLVDSLARRMSEREYFAIGALVMIGIVVTVQLNKQGYDRTDQLQLVGSEFFRSENPDVLVRYKDSKARDTAREALEDISFLVKRLTDRFATIKLTPEFRIHIDTEMSLDLFEFNYDERILRVNYHDADMFDRVRIRAAVLHTMFHLTSSGRAYFEPNYWFADGFSWWLSYQNTDITESQRRKVESELLARAVLSLQRLPADWTVIRQWGRINERVGTRSAEALGFSLVRSLHQHYGDKALDALAEALLLEPVPHNWIVSWRDRFQSFESRFLKLTDIDWSEFLQLWQQDLRTAANSPDVRMLIEFVPKAQGWLKISDSGDLEYGLKSTGGDFLQHGLNDSCEIHHSNAGAYDSHELEADLSRDQDVRNCVSEAAARYSLTKHYDIGDRVFVALEYRMPAFHGPFRMAASRLVLE